MAIGGKETPGDVLKLEAINTGRTGCGRQAGMVEGGW
jgi:hypothetical protein